MWALLSSRLRSWLLLTVAVPVLAALARRLADVVERRRGSGRVSDVLRRAGHAGRRRRR